MRGTGNSNQSRRKEIRGQMVGMKHMVAHHHRLSEYLTRIYSLEKYVPRCREREKGGDVGSRPTHSTPHLRVTDM